MAASVAAPARGPGCGLGAHWGQGGLVYPPPTPVLGEGGLGKGRPPAVYQAEDAGRHRAASSLSPLLGVALPLRWADDTRMRMRSLRVPRPPTLCKTRTTRPPLPPSASARVCVGERSEREGCRLWDGLAGYCREEMPQPIGRPTVRHCTGHTHIYLSGTFITCQRGANSCILRVFSIFRPEHQNFVP